MKDKDITKEKLRALLEDAEWEGGMLVTQGDWQRYLTWALDMLDAKEAVLQRSAAPPKKKKRHPVHHGNKMP